MAGSASDVIGGVDTHGATHHAAAMDVTGRMLGTAGFQAGPGGYRELLVWLRGYGEIRCVGIEGTGSYGAGLCRYLLSEGVRVVEVDRADRKMRRRRGKSDPVDAEAAARSVLAGTAATVPKDRRGIVESIRVLRVARSGAVKARTAAINALRTTVVTAPAELRRELETLGPATLVNVCASLRPRRDRLADPSQATKAALRSIARRVVVLDAEVAEMDGALSHLVREAAPRTVAHTGIGVDHAGQLLVTAGQNLGRLRSEAAFALLCGVAPVSASSGRTDRHRLNRSGDRAANRALHLAVVVRMRCCARTKAYMERRTGQGLSKPEVMRCLKRYVAREVYSSLRADLSALQAL